MEAPKLDSFFFHFLKPIGIAVNKTMRENSDSYILRMVLSVNICR